MEFEPGKRKLQQRGSRFRSRQRAKAMAVALGVAMTITLGLLSLVSSTTVGAENAAGHVTRHLRSLLLDQKAREYGTARDQIPQGAAMEATARRTVTFSPGGPSVGGAAMEALAKPVLRKADAETSMRTSTTSTTTESHGRSGAAMEAIPPRYEKKAGPETIADAVAKAEEAEEIAQEALVVALAAEDDLEAIEALTEASILSLATNSITDKLSGEEILIVGEIEDSDSLDSQEEPVAKKDRTKKHNNDCHLMELLSTKHAQTENNNMPVLTTNASGAAPPVVGVLGGGQLGRMMADAAHRLGLQVLVLDPLGAESPAGQTGLKAVAGSFTNEQDIAKLAEQCDVLTVEIEHVNAAYLQQLQDDKTANLQGVHPAPATIALIQDKYQQKQFFTEVQDVDVAPYEIVTSLQSARQVGEKFGYPYMLKSRRFAYDGKGNAVVKNEKDLVDAFNKLGAKLLASETADVDEKQLAEEEAKLYAEKWVPFVKELAVMVVKGADGDVRAYPVVETTQADSICDTVLAPAQIPEDVAKRAGEMAQAAVAQLEGRGIYGVELFLTATGEVLLNEIAPRPHNSGHYTIEACETNQFEQHLRAITGLPLGSCALRVPAALMVNVLGDATSSEDVSFSLLRNSMKVPGAAAHFYGKAGVRPGRKLGHVTITAPSLEELTKRATALSPEAAKNSGLLKLERKPLVGIVMGSDSDLPTMAAAADMLEKFGVPYELTIVSAHRTPARMYEYAQSADKRGIKVIIAGAGGAAHLPGMIAALTPLPVVGVPVKTSTLNGEDSLLSIVQMPRGVPVATVAIGNSTNAGLLAVRILGAGDSSLIDAMATFLDTQKREVDDKIEKMATSGWKEYLQNMKH